MNSNVKMFITVFCFIVGAVGVVLGVLNLLQQPMAVTGGVIYGGIGLIAFGLWLVPDPQTALLTGASGATKSPIAKALG